MNFDDRFYGNEFDWFAQDVNNNFAIFSSSGQGNIPPSVKLYFLQHDIISKEFELPNYGTIEVWTDFANYGLHVFDWDTQNRKYTKLKNPTKILEDNLKQKIILGYK